MKLLLSARLTVPFWCSFRMPYTINVNYTYPVPPPTTLYGLIGCALGLPADNYSLFSKLDINVGLEQGGEVIETYSRIIKRDPRTPDRRTLLIRQKLLQPIYRLYLQADKDLIEQVAQRLVDPIFPLSLGESDDILEIDQVQVFPAQTALTAQIDSIVPQELAPAPPSNCSSAYLPVGFKRGKRDWAGVDYRLYYVGSRLTLGQPVKAWVAGDKRVVF